jgi:hypothetical protein
MLSCKGLRRRDTTATTDHFQSIIHVAGGRFVRTAIALIASVGILGALYFASAVFMRVAFDLFIIAIVWPLQSRLIVVMFVAFGSLTSDAARPPSSTCCGSTQRKSYVYIVMAGIIGPIIAPAAVIALGSTFGSFRS